MFNASKMQKPGHNTAFHAAAWLRQFVAVALATALLLAAMPVSALFGPEKYAYIQGVADFIRENGYYSELEDDPLERALINLLDTDPQAFDLLLGYMLDSYDDRSMLLPAEYLSSLLQTSGYVGVGVTISQEEDEAGGTTFTVTGLNPQGSAQRAGVREGDLVLEVAGQDTAFISLALVADALRGDGTAGTFVDMVVGRGEERLCFTLERTLLGEPEYAMSPLNSDTWLMRWSQFRDTAQLEAMTADLEAMQADGGRFLVLDLRGNSGGRLDMAYAVVDALIPEKDVHYLTVTSREGDDIVTEEKRSAGGGGYGLEEIIVLCNGETASASEVIMTALCDTGHAFSIGTRTYGKATAQYEIDTPEGSLIVLTAFKMRSVKGLDYDLVGLAPNLTMENESVRREDPGLRLRPVALGPGSCSDDAEALNQALHLLGLMGPAQTGYRFGEDTQAAVNNFRQQRGIPRADGIDAETIELLNQALGQIAGQSQEADRQMEKALEYLSASR